MRRFVVILGLFLLGFATAARAEPQWLTLPPTPSLPTPVESGYAPVNGIRIWYATFGHGTPVILLHGGLANANYWGELVPALAPHYRVIVMDSRGHGRSSRDAQPYGYDLMASDELALMDFLKIDKAALVGWSDGAIIDELARANAELGRFDDAWRCIGEAVTAVETTNERWCEAEVRRVAGEIPLLSPERDVAKAEAYFERALTVARAQQAKSWELRAAMSMAGLWRDQGKPQQAYELLAPIYGWFTEGFDTRDLKEAKALLDELAA